MMLNVNNNGETFVAPFAPHITPFWVAVAAWSTPPSQSGYRAAPQTEGGRMGQGLCWRTGLSTRGTSGYQWQRKSEQDLPSGVIKRG